MCSGCMDLVGLTQTRFDCKLGGAGQKCPGHKSDLDSDLKDRTKCGCCQICRTVRTRLKGKLSNLSLEIVDSLAKADQCCKCGRELRYSYHTAGIGNVLMETSIDRLHDLVESDLLNITALFDVLAYCSPWHSLKRKRIMRNGEFLRYGYYYSDKPEISWS
jgi:hypothetical protein